MLFEDMITKIDKSSTTDEIIKEETIEKENVETSVAAGRTFIDYMNEVNPETNKPYNIPMLSPGNPDYNFMYADIMRLKEVSPTVFNSLMNWE